MVGRIAAIIAKYEVNRLISNVAVALSCASVSEAASVCREKMAIAGNRIPIRNGSAIKL